MPLLEPGLRRRTAPVASATGRFGCDPSDRLGLGHGAGSTACGDEASWASRPPSGPHGSRTPARHCAATRWAHDAPGGDRSRGLDHHRSASRSRAVRRLVRARMGCATAVPSFPSAVPLSGRASADSRGSTGSGAVDTVRASGAAAAVGRRRAPYSCSPSKALCALQRREMFSTDAGPPAAYGIM